MPDRAAAAHAAATHAIGAENSGRTTQPSEEKGTENSEVKTRITMQNSYRLESKSPFDPDRVVVVMDQIMQEMMATAQYEPTASCKLAEQVSSEILKSVKEMNFDRYRIIVTVTIFEKMFQGVSSRCNALWDSQRDDCASCIFTNSSLFAVAVVYGVYYE